MNIVEQALSKTKKSTSVSVNNLMVIPLLAEIDREPDYLTLDEALAQGEVRVTETSEAGDVPELRFENRSNRAVLLVDGEELVGAKQNRVLNLTILVPGKSTIIIPVSCVEAGRWSEMTPEFSTRGRAFFSAGRASKAQQVTDSLRAYGSRRSRQGEVWDEIAAKSERMASFSETAAMACLYEDYQEQVNEYLQAIEVMDGQVGAVFAINGQIRGVELFDCSATCRKLMPKVIKSYALDAIDEESTQPVDNGLDVEGFLSAVAQAEVSVHPAVGEGEDIRISAAEIAGGALEAHGRLIHLCAFRLLNKGSQSGHHEGGVARSSQRIRHFM